MVRLPQTIGRQLSSRLIITFVGIILVTTMVAGALAYWLVFTELEEQAWARVADGKRVTLVLLQAEKTRLDDLVALTAQRPTLQQLLREEDAAAIADYMQPYQSGAQVDILTVYDASRQPLTTGSVDLLCFPPQQRQAADYCVLRGTSSQLALLAGRPILDESTGGTLGYVTVGVLLDEAFIRQLATETGLEQSIFVDGVRITTSLDGIDAAAAEATVTEYDVITNTSTTSPLTNNGKHYYTVRFPLRRADNELVALAEAALPVTELVMVEQQILLTLIASTFLVALAGSIAALMLRYAVKEEAVQHLRSHFLANITHEFRTPLSALRASVEFLVDEMAHLSRSEIDELLRAIHMSVTGLQTLIDNLLESISIEAGRFVIRPEVTELNDVVSEAARIMQPLLNRRQQQLTVSYPEPLPLVYGDSTRLAQVLVNLLSNASKYGPMAQPIDLSVTTTGDNLVRVIVADRGPGISPMKRDNLFRRFSRLNTTDNAQQGIGLGLWVVRAIVSEHGGTVGVDERPGGGSVFWFTVPVAHGFEDAES